MLRLVRKGFEQLVWLGPPQLCVELMGSMHCGIGNSCVYSACTHNYILYCTRTDHEAHMKR